MNMLSAARTTAQFLGCIHAECPKAVLCSEICKDKRKIEDELEKYGGGYVVRR